MGRVKIIVILLVVIWLVSQFVFALIDFAKSWGGILVSLLIVFLAFVFVAPTRIKSILEKKGNDEKDDAFEDYDEYDEDDEYYEDDDLDESEEYDEDDDYDEDSLDDFAVLDDFDD